MGFDPVILIIIIVVLATGIFGMRLFIAGWRHDKALKLVVGLLLLAICATLLFGTIWVLNNVMLHKIGG